MRLKALMSTALAVAGLCSCAARPAPEGAAPRLAVVIVVDQLRADALTGAQGPFAGGIARLVREGAVYPHVLHDHAPTVTAAGHATLLSGRYPASTGVVGNEWFDRELRREVGAVADADERSLDGGVGVSPHRMRGSTLGDWLRGRFPAARVASVARKDRVAALMAGRSSRDVVWYSERSGRFTTSTFYRPEPPPWVRGDLEAAARFAGATWDLLRGDAAAYPGADPDDAPWERGPLGFGRTFPHRLPSDPGALDRLFPATPFADELTLELALAAQSELGLGTDDTPDLLLVGLSACDAIGHTYGPDSLEVHDHLVRVDDMMGRFMNTLERRVGRGRLVVALTSDHGVTEIPERAVAHGRQGGRVAKSALLAAARWAARGAVGRDDVVLDLVNLQVVLDRPAIRAAGRDSGAVAEAVAAAVADVPGVERAVAARRLVNGDDNEDDILRRLRHGFDADRSGDVFVVLQPGDLPEPSGAATHGSPWSADAEVPLVLWGAGVRPGVVEQPVRAVDLAPTLAVLLGVRPSEVLDGEPLAEAIAERVSR